MKKHTKILTIASGVMLFLPVFAYASFMPDCVTGTGNGTTCGFSDLIQLVNSAISWFLGVAIAAAAITFAIAGAKMLFNPGNAGKRSEAIEMFKKTVIGLVIVLAAWLIVHTIVSVFVTGGNPFIFIGK